MATFSLKDIYNDGFPAPAMANSTLPIAYPEPKTQTLPNGGGSFNPAGNSTITPAPVFTGIKPTAPVTAPKPKVPQRNFYKKDGSYYFADTNQKILTPTDLGVASQTGVEVPPPTVGAGFSPVPGVNYDKYRDPKTGEIMSPEEYAIFLGNKVPKGNGEITNYAGDALANPNQTTKQLSDTANNLNNSRNDIATGTTDPYKIGSQSGIAYSPTELKAIEKAYAGIYDPALNDVFSRLKETQAADKEKADLQASKEMEIFKTNESIRQWKATTGTKKTGGSGSKMFTQTQLNTAARNAGVSVSVIEDMDEDLINFFISPKKAEDYDGKETEIGKAYASWFKAVKDGNVAADDVVDGINSTSLSPAVKTFYIDQIPAEPEEKEGWFSRVWGAVTGN